MSITVASWNMLNAFGDPDRVEPALDLIKQADADIIYLCEMTLIKDFDGPAFKAASMGMAALGYDYHVTAEATPVPGERNLQTMGLWARQDWSLAKGRYGKRHGLAAFIPELNATITGLHADDRFPKERTAEAADILAHRNKSNSELCLIGDLNNIHPDDPAGRKYRWLNRLFGWIEVGDYYDPGKPLKRWIGKRTRLYRMAGGAMLGQLRQAGLSDADVTYQPTFNAWGFDVQLDHILTSGGITSDNFKILDMPAIKQGILSDHKLIMANISNN